MEVKEISQVLAKRSCGITSAQWNDFLEQLEKFGLYLVICSSKPGLAKSPAGGFIPMPSRDDELRLMTAEELQSQGLKVEHQILPYRQKENQA